MQRQLQLKCFDGSNVATLAITIWLDSAGSDALASAQSCSNVTAIVRPLPTVTCGRRIFKREGRSARGRV